MDISDLSTERLIQNGDLSRYSLIIGISKRARQISQYNENMGIQTDEKPVIQAAESFARHEFDIIEQDDPQ